MYFSQIHIAEPIFVSENEAQIFCLFYPFHPLKHRLDMKTLLYTLILAQNVHVLYTHYINEQ